MCADGSSGAGGLTRLSVHWLKLGIGLERIKPGHPEQNGRHERMHGTLKAETLRPPASTPAEQQCRFDDFRRNGLLLPATEAAPWQATTPALHDLQPRDVFRELLKEKGIEGEELGAVFDELLASREAKVIA